MKKTQVKLDSMFGEEIGFTSDKFGQQTHIWFDGLDMYFTKVCSKDIKFTFPKKEMEVLINTLLERGFNCKIRDSWTVDKNFLIGQEFEKFVVFNDFLNKSITYWLKKSHKNLIP
ncbi:MAG: hypothetical protein KJI71_00640 [Patescibacteria group bacterium]|nr:hypothetical protein [Patescibacteria group bacterium]